MTRCSYVEPRLRALADGELSVDEQRKVVSHLHCCDACRQGYARIQAVSALLQEQPVEEMPAHFSTELQVRLARHRRERAEASLRRPRFRLPEEWLPWNWAPRWRASSVAMTATVTAGLCVFAWTGSIRAEEVARRAQQSWTQIHNYGCVFVSRGVYRGQPRVFEQKQFYRKPGEFRLETDQDYPLTTFVRRGEMIHYLPGGRWEGKGPLVIVRPLEAPEQGLPFPFGVTWHNGGNVSLDQLIRQLGDNQDVQLHGTEQVGGFPCYRLQFHSVPLGGVEPDRYDLWIDKETFLPRRVDWYRDEKNHITTEARDLQVNYEVLPTETFDFRIPEGACVVRGDLDPHVLALPIRRNAPASLGQDPLAVAEYEGWARARNVTFPVSAPSWLPDGFRMIRTRAKRGGWVDMHWIRPNADGAMQVVKLVQQDGETPAIDTVRDGARIELGDAERPAIGAMTQRSKPYRHTYLSWKQGGTRFTLFAAELQSAEVLRIARSLRAAQPPVPTVTIVQGTTEGLLERGEPSVLPSGMETELAPSVEAALPREQELDVNAMQQPPMMPEIPVDDGVALTSPEPAGRAAPR